MKTRLIIQLNEDTGEKNVVFTTDPLTPDEDFLVASWPNSKVITTDVLLIGMNQDAVEALLEVELHGVVNNPAGDPLTELETVLCKELLNGGI